VPVVHHSNICLHFDSWWWWLCAPIDWLVWCFGKNGCLHIEPTVPCCNVCVTCLWYRSCKLGSVFAPESGLRYDGIYRIEMCWQRTNLEVLHLCNLKICIAFQLWTWCIFTENYCGVGPGWMEFLHSFKLSCSGKWMVIFLWMCWWTGFQSVSILVCPLW
jgi:hypothetical protein